MFSLLCGNDTSYRSIGSGAGFWWDVSLRFFSTFILSFFLSFILMFWDRDCKPLDMMLWEGVRGGYLLFPQPFFLIIRQVDGLRKKIMLIWYQNVHSSTKPPWLHDIRSQGQRKAFCACLPLDEKPSSIRKGKDQRARVVCLPSGYLFGWATYMLWAMLSDIVDVNLCCPSLAIWLTDRTFWTPSPPLRKFTVISSGRRSLLLP